jgi:CubicO group peptidase (beta-lactamase class C family)
MHRRELLKTFGLAGVAGATTRLGDGRVAIRVISSRSPSTGSDELQARVEAAIAKHKVPGASVALFKDGKLETAAAGVVNVATGVPTTPDTVMHIGSITKTLNTTLVMQLVDEGRLALDQPVRKYLPDFRVADPSATERITVKMLLNHTSGINGELTPEAGHDQERIVDGIGRIAKMDQLHAPGADMSYCNPAMVVAGYLAQRVTGKSWYDLMKERLFGPLEMTHSIVVPEDALLYRASVGHFLNPADGTNTRTSFAFLPLSYAPAGATAMLSATDLVTFARAHLNDGVGPNGKQILSAAGAQAMRVKTAHYQGAGFTDFGLGWQLMPNGILTHGGGGPGILSTLYLHPASGTAIAVLTNAAHGNAVTAELVRPLVESWGGRIASDVAADLVKQATDAPVDPAPYVGTYEGIATAVRIIPQGTGIALTTRSKFKIYDSTSLAETKPVVLRPIKDGQFALGTAVISFVNPDRAGKMGHIAMGGRLAKRTG